MQQFVLVGDDASYPVPLGESRAGSDAACPICIRGEGILPVHAYLRADVEKLLIRPAAANGSSSNGSGVGSITVNGEALAGPVGSNLACVACSRCGTLQPDREPDLRA